VRCALIERTGAEAVFGQTAAPKPAAGEVLVELRAAGLNPIDVAVAAGRHYEGQPPLPYVPGCEGVGAVDADRLVYVFRGGIGLRRNGTLAELVAASDEAIVPLPDGADPALAVACGIAGLAGWVPVTRVADAGPNDRVLVLGATGAVGRVAVQAARLRRAARIVAAGRSPGGLEDARELGADATVEIGAGDLAQGITQAFEGDGPTVVIDPLWGEPAAAAIRAAARGARIVQLGTSAGQDATLRSADIRGRQLHIIGFSNFALPKEELAESYRELVTHATAGQVRIEFETLPLERVAEAWRLNAEGGHKVVVTP
jgi:NADPH:quinone reductase